MEEDFLDLGFVDSAILDDVKPVTEEPENPEETQETQEDKKPEEKKEDIDNNKEVKRTESAPSDNKETGSPNLSSSIAQALVDEGILQTLDEERLSKITNAQSLLEAQEEEIDNRVDSKLTEIQKRVNDALNYGVEPTRIQQYEQWIKTLNDVTDETLEGEETENENYRKNLIYQNYIAKGFEKDDALDMVNRSVESGKDVEDAKKALSSLKKYYEKAYNTEVAEAKKQHDKYVADQKKQFEELKTSILEDKDNFYEQFELGKSARQKIFDVVAKPSIVEDDKRFTPLQKFIKDNPNKANKIIGTLYVLTDGFTDFKGLMKGEVKKQVRKSVENLEKVLSQSRTVTDGSLQFKSGIGAEIPNNKIVDFDFSEFDMN